MNNESYFSPRPDASVIIVNYNGGSLLAETLEALFMQESVSFEAILVDNGSQDNSLIKAESRWKDRLIVIKNPTNRGFGAANNQGFAASRGRYIVLLNNDAVPEPGWLKELVSAGDNDPEAGMIASKILQYESPALIDNVGHRLGLDGINRGLGRGEEDIGQYDGLNEILFPSGCAAAYRRSLFEKTGGFDEEFFVYGDDAELGLNGLARGFKAILCPAAVVKHRYSQTLGEGSAEKIYWVERNRLLVWAKYFPAYSLPLALGYTALRYYFSALSAISGVGAAGRSVKKTGFFGVAEAVVKANLDGLKLMPKMYAKKLELKKSGALPDAAFKKLRPPFFLSPFKAAIEE